MLKRDITRQRHLDFLRRHWHKLVWMVRTSWGSLSSKKAASTHFEAPRLGVRMNPPSMAEHSKSLTTTFKHHKSVFNSIPCRLVPDTKQAIHCSGRSRRKSRGPSDAENLEAVIVADRDPVGLRWWPLDLIDLASSGVGENRVLDGSRHLLDVPDQRLMVVGCASTRQTKLKMRNAVRIDLKF